MDSQSANIPPSPDSQTIQNLLREIDAGGRALSHRPGARTELIARARSLISALETPIESIIWMAWAEVRKLFYTTQLATTSVSYAL